MNFTHHGGPEKQKHGQPGKCHHRFSALEEKKAIIGLCGAINFLAISL